MFDRMDRLACEGIPFFFMTDFEGGRVIVMTGEELARNRVYFDIPGATHLPPPKKGVPPDLRLVKHPGSFSTYRTAFNFVQEAERAGYSYLANLTFSTPISINRSLVDIFREARAPYKLLVPDSFVVFSPESFISVKDNYVTSNPMKGTIDAGLPDAAGRLLRDEKEAAEHITICDLIRNDLNMIADAVRVKRFKYLQKIHTEAKDLLQMSSTIGGRLKPRYINKPGSFLERLLPAGSISGAPKKKTLEIIRAAESHERGFYTGVFGLWKPGIMESAVMIRFIEQTSTGMVYKSGGGITVYSDARMEYDEMVDKIYVPIT